MKMRFKDFTFPSNPSSLEIGTSTRVSTASVFGKTSEVSNVSVNPTIIRGSGEFYGERAQEHCAYLQHLLRLKTSGALLLPSEHGYNAYLTDFTFKRNADKNAVCYSFTFTEDCSSRAEERQFYYTVAHAGENAFDIAHRCSVSVNTIMQKNDFKTPFDIDEGERVVLR